MHLMNQRPNMVAMVLIQVTTSIMYFEHVLIVSIQGFEEKKTQTNTTISNIYSKHDLLFLKILKNIFIYPVYFKNKLC